MKLVVAASFFDDALPHRLEHDKCRTRSRKRRLSNTPRNSNFKLWHGGGRDGFAVNRAPRHEAFLVRADGADARLQAVGNNQHRVVDEQRRDLLLVGFGTVRTPARCRVFRPRIF